MLPAIRVDAGEDEAAINLISSQEEDTPAKRPLSAKARSYVPRTGAPHTFCQCFFATFLSCKVPGLTAENHAQGTQLTQHIKSELY